MAGLLEVSELVEQRVVIRFWLSEGENPVKIYSHVTKHCGKSCMNRRNFYKRLEQFKYGRISVTDEHRSGRPIEVSTFYNFLHDYRAINSTYYSDTLTNKVKPAVIRKRPGFLCKGVILLHDNVRPHTAHQ